MLFDEIVAGQAGVISLQQAVAAGISARTVQRRVAEGRWRRLHPRVYLVGGHNLGYEARIWAAHLWAGERSTVSGIAAAYWHGMISTPGVPILVTVPRAVRLTPTQGAQLRRRDLDRHDRECDRGLWVLPPPLAALETAVLLEDGSVFLDRALQKHVSFEHVYRAYTRNLGARGSAAAGKLLIAAADRAGSAAERIFHRLLKDAGITGWRVGVPFGPYELDVAFEAERVAVEVDGWAWHVDPTRFRNDRRKGNVLARAGWQLLRFTWHDLTERPRACVAEIRELLARPAA
jgi:very-short-patch-repair endonuclease